MDDQKEVLQQGRQEKVMQDLDPLPLAPSRREGEERARFDQRTKHPAGRETRSEVQKAENVFFFGFFGFLGSVGFFFKNLYPFYPLFLPLQLQLLTWN
jgi:hypothetical protein